MLPTAVVLVLVIVIGVIIARRGPSTPTYRYAPAALGTVQQTVDVTGTLQPSAETDLDFGTNGHVQGVAVQAGQNVKAGTVLATLDPEQANAALVQAQSALDSASAKLNQDAPGATNVTQTQGKSTVNTAQAAIGPDQANLNDTIAEGQSQVRGAQVTLQTALAAAQGLITQDQQLVVSDTAQLNDSKAADAAAIAAANSAVAQAEASAQATVNNDQAAVNTAKANLSGSERLDQATINADQATVNNDQKKLSADQSATPNPGKLTIDQGKLTTDEQTLATDEEHSDASCSTGPPSPACQADEAAVVADQQTIAADNATIAADEAALNNSGAVGQDQANLTAAQNALKQAQAALKADQQTGQAQVDAADAALNGAERQATADVANAQATAATDRANALKDADTNQGALNDAIVQLQNAKVAFANSQANDQAQIAQAQTAATHNNDTAAGQLTQATTDLQNSLAEYAALTQGQIPQTVVQDEAQVAADQTAVKSAQDNVAGTQLIAPVDGMVQEVNVADGQPIGSAAASAGALAASAASGQPTSGNNAEGNLTHAIVMITPQAFQVSGPVSDAQLPQVKPGDQVDVTPAGGGEQLLGHVTGIAPSALITQGVATFTVTAVLDGINPNVHAGSTAQMSIVVERDVDVLTVPTSAVHTVGAGSYVLVPRNGQEVQLPVTVGASDPSRTQILSGLNKGDLVILAQVGAQPPTANPPSFGGGGGTRGAGGGGGGGGGGTRGGG